MAYYAYRARGNRGELVEGTLDAGSPDAVATQLLNTGVTPIDIRLTARRVHRNGLLADLTRRRRVTLDDLIIFVRQLYALTKAGVPIVRGLNGLKESSRSQHMGEALGDVVSNLEAGHDLAGSLARHPKVFSALIVSTVRLGENSGRLEESLDRIYEYLQVEKDTRERVRGALRYPVLVLVAISVAIGIINVWVIPAFSKVFERVDVPLPLPTRFLISTSDFMVAHGPFLLALILGVVLGLRLYIRTDPGRFRWDRLLLRVPIVGDILHRAALARFARGFAMSLRAGVPVIQALTVVAGAVDNAYLTEHILRMRNGVERGDTLTRTAAVTGLFTPLVLQMLAVGEETGQVDDLLDEVAGFYEREVDYDVKNLSAAVEPLLLLAVGAMVLILALGVFLPMWNLSSAFHS